MLRGTDGNKTNNLQLQACQAAAGHTQSGQTLENLLAAEAFSSSRLTSW